MKAEFYGDFTDRNKCIFEFENVYLTSEEYLNLCARFDNSKLGEIPNGGEDYNYKQYLKAKEAILKHKEDKILFAEYYHESYEGTAFVLFKKDGKLYEIHARHCSCYGLEDQWNPEETSIKALKDRLKNRSSWSMCPSNEFALWLGSRKKL